MLDAISLYSRVVNCSVVGQKCTLLTTLGLTKEPKQRNKNHDDEL